jgi:hypothetical protein
MNMADTYEIIDDSVSRGFERRLRNATKREWRGDGPGYRDVDVFSKAQEWKMREHGLNPARVSFGASGSRKAPPLPPMSPSTSRKAPALHPTSLSTFGKAPMLPPTSPSTFGKAPALHPTSLSTFRKALALPPMSLATSERAPALDLTSLSRPNKAPRWI